jgi:hypothetical protein
VVRRRRMAGARKGGDNEARARADASWATAHSFADEIRLFPGLPGRRACLHAVARARTYCSPATWCPVPCGAQCVLLTSGCPGPWTHAKRSGSEPGARASRRVGSAGSTATVAVVIFAAVLWQATAGLEAGQPARQAGRGPGARLDGCCKSRHTHALMRSLQQALRRCDAETAHPFPCPQALCSVDSRENGDASTRSALGSVEFDRGLRA